MEQSLPMVKQVVERHIPWWVAIKVKNQKELFQELSVKSSQSPKASPVKTISYVAVLLKSIMKKFMICSVKM
jgi:hypothetical protein